MKHEPATPGSPPNDDQFVANGIRLGGREWLFVALVFSGLLLFLPALWERVETFAPETDYRIPHALSEDYWLYERWARRAAADVDTLVVGDSVVWGEYVLPDATLTHYLNESAGERRFANLALAGMHPAPLAGLVEHYGGAIQRKNVILHLNPLWLSSPRHDLGEEKEFVFNHPDLVPQFVPRVPCYKSGVAERIARVVRRHVPFCAWTRHLQIAFFEHRDIPAWTFEHPYESPLDPIRLETLEADRTLRHSPISWRARGIRAQDFSWVDTQSSLQWRSFQRTVGILQRRENRVMVVVGPFNEHQLTETGREAYRRVKSTLVEWLAGNGIPYVAPKPLPADLYADASHPLAKGYAVLASELLENDLFRSWEQSAAK